MPGACPSDNQLAALLEGGQESGVVRRHVGECETCRALTAELLRGFSPAAPLPAPGQKIGAYELGPELGRGGMGVVFSATDTRLKRTVAIKFAARRLVGDLDAEARFRREAQAAASLRHPNVAALFEAAESDGLHYLVFEMVEGMSLAERIALGRMSESEALPILIQLAGGVAAAHACGIVHRDLKPGNVMVQPDGTIKLLDFGLAKISDNVTSSIRLITLTREVLGTLAYMAPEQQLGQADDPRVDIWAIGAVAYHLLTGRAPFGMAPAEIVRAQAAGELTPLRTLHPEISRDLEVVVRRCLSLDPAHRPSTAQVVADDLGRIARGEPIFTRPSSLGYRVGKTLGRHRALATVAFLALVSVTTLGRHRALATVAFLALVSVTTLGGYGLSVRRGASERAGLARDLGRSAQQIRSTLRNAHLLPLHDTRPERAAVNAQMREVEAQMQRAGSDGDGPGNAALGEGWAALGDPRRARTHLEAAWAKGERNPDLAAALGITLGAIYDEESRRARHLANEKARQAELIRTLRDPALEYLRAATGATDTTPDYVAARMALLEKRYDQAILLAHKAFSQAQSLYEAGLVEAIALQNLGRHEWMIQNDHAAAKALWARMREVENRVADVARSDAAAYTGIVDNEVEVEWLLANDGSEMAALEARTLRLVDAAIAANPDDARAYQLRADLLFQRAEFGVDSGKDPLPNLTQSLASSARAVALDPRCWKAFREMGAAYNLQGNWEALQNADPQPSLRKSLAAYEQSHRIEPDPDIYRMMGVVYGALAEWKVTRGLDPLPECEDAIRLYRQAESGSDEHSVRRYIADTLRVQAEALDRTGGDPLPVIAAALSAYSEALGHGDLWSLHASRAAGLGEQAFYLLKRGAPAAEPLAQAWVELAKARPEGAESLPSNVSQHLAINEALRALLEGRDPTAWVKKAHADGERVHAVDPTDAFVLSADARADLIGAEGARRRGASPQSALEHASSECERAMSMKALDVDTLTTAAEVQRRLAAWAQSRHLRPTAAVTAAHALLDRALKVTDRVATARLERSALFRISAAEERQAERKAELTRRAAEELAAARALDPRVDFLEPR